MVRDGLGAYNTELLLKGYGGAVDGVASVAAHVQRRSTGVVYIGLNGDEVGGLSNVKAVAQW